ncbi:hypothetical protein BJV78DRAFT_1283739 [Lactifluus subvellereus]|nr:hypothetical protein BJV78DRAFT_1283739 [Lactifluus subvellereus]
MVVNIVLVLNQVAVSLILARRIFALYRDSRIIIIGTLGFGASLVSVTCWALSGQQPIIFAMIPKSWKSFSHPSPPRNSGIRLAATWEAQALFDAFIFVLTVMRTVKICREHNMAINLPGMGLLDILLRDGAIYFAIMGLANLANILAFYFARPPLRTMFTTPASCISVTLCSRLVLNLYEAATPDTTTSNTSFELMTTCVLTVRTEPGTSTGD